MSDSSWRVGDYTGVGVCGGEWLERIIDGRRGVVVVEGGWLW